MPDFSKWLPDLQLWLPHVPTALLIVLASALLTVFFCRKILGSNESTASHFTDGDNFEIQQQLSRLKAKLSDYEENDQQRQARIHDLEQEIAATDQKQQETLQEVTRAKRSLANTMANLETLKNERDGLSIEIQGLQQERESFAAQETNASSYESRILQLTEALRESEYQVSRLGTEIQLLRTVRTEFEALRNDNEDLEEDIRRLQNELKSMENHVNRLAADANASRAERISAEQELAEAREEIRQLNESAKIRKASGSAPVEAAPALSLAPVGDALIEIPGISPGLQGKLNDLGIRYFHQIAAWSDADVSHFSERLGFQDRITRDRWVEEATARIGLSNSGSQTNHENEVEATEDSPPPSTPEPSSSTTHDDQDIEQPSLFFTGFSDFMAEPEPIKPPDHLANPPSDVDAELLLEDPLLGKVYRRPPSKIDDLTRIKGIARVIEGKLHEIGIFRYSQIARWTPRQVEAFSRRLSFKDRIQRDRWIEQCQEFHQEPEEQPDATSGEAS